MVTGLCECGCGVKTKIATRNRLNRDWIKGQPIRFIAGHYNNIKNRIWPQYIIDKGGCWIWQLSKNPDGYASYAINGKYISGHRYFFEEKYGKIPKNGQLDHLCKNRICVNPDHLEVVTQTENIRRGKHTKLTKANVISIKKMINAGYKNKDIALLYKVIPNTISHIKTNRNWKDV